MKKGLLFLIGMIVGAVLAVMVLFVIGVSRSNKEENRIQIAEQPTLFTLSQKFEIFQVLDGGALAHCEEKGYSGSMFVGPVVYILNNGQELFYNDQIVPDSSNKKAIQVGTYRYQTKMGEKVVPVIKFE